MCVPQYQCKDPGQLAAVDSSIMSVLGIEPRSPGLAAAAFLPAEPSH